MNKVNIKMEMECGVLMVSSLRYQLELLKHDILWHEEDTRVNIDEIKSFMRRTFIVTCHCSEKMAISIKDWYNKAQARYSV